MGTTLKAKDGTSVDPFSFELVENTLPTVHVVPVKLKRKPILVWTAFP